MKTRRVSACLVLCLVSSFAVAQDEVIPSQDFLDFLGSWDTAGEEWLDHELDNEDREQAITRDEEADNVD